MRPDAIAPLFASVQSLEGIGPKLTTLLRKALGTPAHIGEPRLLDLVRHMPTGVIDRRAQPDIASAIPGTIVTVRARIVRHNAPPRNSRAPYRIVCEDETGTLTLIFFRGDRRFLEGQAPVGETRLISGRVEAYGDKLQISHPDYIVPPEKADALPLLEPVYPLTAGLQGRGVIKAVRQALERVPELDEWIDASLMAQEDWPAFDHALNAIHRPETPDDISVVGKPWQRLAYDELLAGQLALAMVRDHAKSAKGRQTNGDGRIRARIRDSLPFSLTGSQENALKEIWADMAAPTRMLRLLQGDVGSGKTAVSLMAMAAAIEVGGQAGLMAPTEVLARQHAETIEPLASAVGLTIGLLTGREKGKARASVLERLAAGEIDILIGTHALFQPDVIFKDLALAVIDEQHRFGVHQRLALQQKGGALGADVLVMTATPIPRTLLMTHYGDLDVSRLTEKPAGRKPVVTVAKPVERIEDVVRALGRALSEGAQAYWVCPLVEGTATSELAAAEERAGFLRQYYGDQVGLVHGQMSAKAKDAAMAAFTANEMKVLVSTTVIEVGVNVPNASIMVIEHAERFGLAQLHQLRGRVGRGSRASTCILLYAEPLSTTAKSRIETMRETEDGFVIAEQDLKLRGGGEVMGTRQSGDATYRLANVPNFDALLATAHDDARLHLTRDPKLDSPRGQALRTLLYLMEQDEAVRLFRAG